MFFKKKDKKKIDDIGVDKFLEEINSVFLLSDDVIIKLKDFIIKSKCKNIKFAEFKIPVLGFGLHNGVFINKILLEGEIENLFYVIFHELAHQFQFNKYGYKLYDCYIGDLSDIESASLAKKIEEIAEDFGARKIREYQKLKLLNEKYEPPRIYKLKDLILYENMISKYKKKFKENNINSPEKICKYFYEFVIKE